MIPIYCNYRIYSQIATEILAFWWWRKAIWRIDRPSLLMVSCSVYKGKSLCAMVRGLENPCLLTSLWNWLGPLWRVDELLYLLVLSKLLLTHHAFVHMPLLQSDICMYVCVYVRSLHIHVCDLWGRYERERESVMLCKVWYHPHSFITRMYTCENVVRKSLTVFDTWDREY